MNTLIKTRDTKDSKCVEMYKTGDMWIVKVYNVITGNKIVRFSFDKKENAETVFKDYK